MKITKIANQTLSFKEAINDDKKLAQEKETIETISFDLEKTLSLPKVPTNIVYYKRQLCVYNLGIHSAKQTQDYYIVLFWLRMKPVAAHRRLDPV